MILERDIENYLVKRAKEAGGVAYKFTSPSRRGVPDRVCVFPNGCLIFVECKAPKKKPTVLQVKEIEKLRNLGQEVFVVDSKETIDDILGSL
jgi:Holliday junction resolvase